MPLFSEHISNMYYSGSSYSAPYSYKSSVLPLGGSYSASYLSPGSNYSNHSSLGGYSRVPVVSRWTPSSGRNYAPILSTISERSTSSPSRITSPRRIPILKRSYNPSSYIPRPININTADIDVSRNKYTPRASDENENVPQSEPITIPENGPFMPRIDGKPETGIDSSPGEHKSSTIKRGRTVVRLHTIKRKERDSLKKEDQDNETAAVDLEESVGWRERLSEDLVYKDKREKKTLGAKLVEKFIVKASDDADTITKRSPKTETEQNATEPISTKPPKGISPERRYSMELLAEQANLLDSLIRNENLSTASLDLSKVGIAESKDNVVAGSTKRRKANNDGNPLQTTKSDYSLHDRINSLKDQKDSNHFSKRRSLKKSLSGGSIRRLASITEFPKEISSNNNLPAIEENRLSVKEEISKKDVKPKAKRKQKITTSVEITESVSSPKFKVGDVTVEEKTIFPKKEFTYSSTVDNNIQENDVILQKENASRINKVRCSTKRKSKSLFRRESDEGSPEPDDGNFWDKIGKRETVYLMKRKQFIEDEKEKHRRAMFWFEGDDECDTQENNPKQCDDSINTNTQDSDICSNSLNEKSEKYPLLEQNHNICDVAVISPPDKIMCLSPVLIDDKKTKEQKNTMTPPVDDVRFTRSSIKNTYLSKNCIPSENKVLEAKLASIANDKVDYNNINAVNTVPIIEQSKFFSEENAKLNKTNEEIPVSIIEQSKKSFEDNKLTIQETPTNQNKKLETIQVKLSSIKSIIEPERIPHETEKVVEEKEKCNNIILDSISENVDAPKIIIGLPGTTNLEDEKILMKDPSLQLNQLVIKTENQVTPVTISNDKTATLQNCINDETPSTSYTDKNKDMTTVTEKIQTPTILQDKKPVDLKNNICAEKTNILLTEMKRNDSATETTQLEPSTSSEIPKCIKTENIPIAGNDLIITPEEIKLGENEKADNILNKNEQKNITQLSPASSVKPVTSPRKPVKEEPAVRPLIATPRPLQKKVPQVVHSSSSEESSSEETSSEDEDADDSDTSEGSTEFFECETNPDGRTSTGSNDSGFDSSAPASPAGLIHVKKDCDVNCHRKCEKLTANLCGVNQRLLVEALASQSTSKRGGDSPGPSTASAPAPTTEILEQELEQSTAYSLFRKTGRFTPPAKSIPRFRKYNIDDFQFIKVLGKGSFGKVLLAELRDTEYYYAVKCLKKDVVLEDDDVECTLIERKVLALGTNHPYLCHLFATFQTDSHLFFVMEYLNGGDLMFHIQQSGRFPEARARFYAAEIVSGLKFLHKRGIVYRDLKLDNILLDYEGHVRIADFGMCKLQIYLEKTADTFCGTPDYMAPEIIKGLKYNQTVDWWSFGVLLYEMLIGQSPFSGCDEDELFWSICNEMPSYPRFLSQEALTILTRLLDKDSRTRMGGTDCMHGDIRDQDFFRAIHWERLERRELEGPFKPRVRHPLDTQYFDRAFTGERPRLTTVEPNVLRSMDQGPFRGFSYTNPNATDR